LAEALPAPGAAVLRWGRATPGRPGERVTYHIYQQRNGRWDFANPIESVCGTDWVVLGLAPGVPQRFIVRAADATGRESNERALTVTPTGAVPAAEWRGVWVTRFEWASGDRATIEGRLRTIFETLAAGNFNAVVFQVRGQGDTLYPSREEPWSAMLNRDARTGDPVAFALAEARRNGIQFHAWMNLSTIWQSSRNPPAPPADKSHPFYRFADASSPATRLGLIHDSKGAPKQWGEDGYVWLTHGNPEVNAYLRRQVDNFLATYAVDGLHIDDRTGNPNGISRDPVSVRRFEGRGNPARIADFGEWQRDQLTRFLSDVYTVAHARNPRLLVSGSPFGIADRRRIPGYSRFNDCVGFGVEPERWLDQGVLDVLMPQVYWDMPDPEPNYTTIVRDWMAHNRGGRPIWPGSNLRKFGAEQPLVPMQQRYIAHNRALGLNGNQFYSWGAATPAEWRRAGRILYPQPARVPVPAHLAPGRPVGQIMGVVRDASGNPVVDAWIRVTGRNYTWLSSADGFFGIPNLAAGSYKVEVTAPGLRAVVPVTVMAGRTIPLRITLR
jgi:uncharacterized lipoprotein YddW (UPF0748 family)